MAAPRQTPEIESSATASVSKRPGIREHRKHPMFDTLQVTNDLKRGGLAEPQAEAIVSAFSTVFQDMVTKDDLKAALKDYPTKEELRADLKAALKDYPTKEELRADLKAALKDYPTKEELRVEVKAALEDYPTKEELRADLKAALKDYPTKEELRVEVKAALEGYPTRAGIEKGFKDFYRRFVYIAVAIVGVNATVTAMLFGAFSMMIRSHL